MVPRAAPEPYLEAASSRRLPLAFRCSRGSGCQFTCLLVPRASDLAPSAESDFSLNVCGPFWWHFLTKNMHFSLAPVCLGGVSVKSAAGFRSLFQQSLLTGEPLFPPGGGFYLVGVSCSTETDEQTNKSRPRIRPHDGNGNKVYGYSILCTEIPDTDKVERREVMPLKRPGWAVVWGPVQMACGVQCPETADLRPSRPRWWPEGLRRPLPEATFSLPRPSSHQQQ